MKDFDVGDVPDGRMIDGHALLGVGAVRQTTMIRVIIIIIEESLFRLGI